VLLESTLMLSLASLRNALAKLIFLIAASAGDPDAGGLKMPMSAIKLSKAVSCCAIHFSF